MLHKHENMKNIAPHKFRALENRCRSQCKIPRTRVYVYLVFCLIIICLPCALSLAPAHRVLNVRTVACISGQLNHGLRLIPLRVAQHRHGAIAHHRPVAAGVVLENVQREKSPAVRFRRNRQRLAKMRQIGK